MIKDEEVFCLGNSVELVHLRRGPMIESMHCGDVAVVDAEGRLIAWAGDPKAKSAYWRSSAKPFQAMAIAQSGALEHYDIAENELSQMCASHSGEDIHIATVRGILKKIGLDETYLQCGSHYPSHAATQDRMRRAGETPTEVHCNCSGKHSGMLALCQQIGADPKTYTELQHPVQQLDLEEVAAFTGVPKEQIVIGVDGCGVPVHGIPVYNMALAWARLVNPQGMSEARANAAQRIRTAMMHYPYLVAGGGRTCTQLMEAIPGRIVAKSGADAVYCFALPEKGWGCALKIADGGSRAVGPAVYSLLKQLGHFSEAELAPLAKMEATILKNHRQDVVGDIRAVFELQWAK